MYKPFTLALLTSALLVPSAVLNAQPLAPPAGPNQPGAPTGVPACEAPVLCSKDQSLRIAIDARGQIVDSFRLGNISATVVDSKGQPVAKQALDFLLLNAQTGEVFHAQQRVTDAQGKADLYGGKNQIDFVPADHHQLTWVVNMTKANGESAEVLTPVFSRPPVSAADLAMIPEGTWLSAKRNELSGEAAKAFTFAKPTKIIRVAEGTGDHRPDNFIEALKKLSGKMKPSDVVEIQLFGERHHLPSEINLNGATLRLVGMGSGDQQAELIRHKPNPKKPDTKPVVVKSPIELVNVRIQPETPEGTAFEFRADARLEKVHVKASPVPFEEDNADPAEWANRLAQSVQRAQNPAFVVRPSTSKTQVTLTVANSTFEHVAGIHVEGDNTRALVHSNVFTGMPLRSSALTVANGTTQPSVFVNNQVDLGKGGHAVHLHTPGSVVADTQAEGKARLVSPKTLASIEEAAKAGPLAGAFKQVKDLIPHLGTPTVAVYLGNGLKLPDAVLDGVKVSAGKVTNLDPAPADPKPHNPGGNAPGPVVPPVRPNPKPPVVKPSPSASSIPSPGPSTQPGKATQQRLAGQNRIETAIAINKARNLKAPKRIFIASADNPADAVAGSPLAAKLQAPLFVTWKDKVDPRLAEALDAMVGPETQITFLGGDQAIHPSTAQQLATKAKTSNRLAGLNRADTATKIADELLSRQPFTKVIVADGQTWEAPILAGPAAIQTNQMVLLSNGNQAAPETTQWLATHKSISVDATIGRANEAHKSPKALTGSTPVELSLAVAKTFFDRPTHIGVATALKPTDAMVAGPAMGNGPILLVDKHPSNTQMEWIKTHPSATILIFGGHEAVHDLKLPQ